MSLLVQIRRPFNSTVLSNASLSLDDEYDTGVYGTRYRRRGYRITRLKEPRTDRMTIYPVVLIPPTKGWYPSSMANFTFGFQSRSPEWFLNLVPRYFNPSIWLSGRHADHYVLRVPKDRAKEAWSRLYAKNLWYHGGKNMWFRRRKRTRIE